VSEGERECRRAARQSTMQPDPIANLLSVLDLVEQHGSPELAEWYSESICTYMEGGSLDEALGLKGIPSRRRPITRHRDLQRLKHLRSAWLCLGPDLPWPRADRLANKIQQFQSTIWPVWCNLDSPPKEASQLRTALFLGQKVWSITGRTALVT